MSYDIGNDPLNLTGGQLLGKILIGLVVGAVISGVIFMLIMFSGNAFGQMVSNQTSSTMNPMLPLVMMIIGFIATFIGSVCIAGIYNLAYSDIYYDMGMMVSKSLSINIVIGLILIPLYFLFLQQPSNLYAAFAFHVGFSVFMTHTVIEFISHVNYSASHLIGTTMGFATIIVIYVIIYSFTSKIDGMQQYLVTLPPILSYTIMPLSHGMWSAIYYKIFEGGSNFLYIPSLNEVAIDQAEEDDEVNVG